MSKTKKTENKVKEVEAETKVEAKVEDKTVKESVKETASDLDKFDKEDLVKSLIKLKKDLAASEFKYKTLQDNTNEEKKEANKKIEELNAELSKQDDLPELINVLTEKESLTIELGKAKNSIEKYESKIKDLEEEVNTLSQDDSKGVTFDIDGVDLNAILAEYKELSGITVPNVIGIDFYKLSDAERLKYRKKNIGGATETLSKYDVSGDWRVISEVETLISTLLANPVGAESIPSIAKTFVWVLNGLYAKSYIKAEQTYNRYKV